HHDGRRVLVQSTAEHPHAFVHCLLDHRMSSLSHGGELLSGDVVHSAAGERNQVPRHLVTPCRRPTPAASQPRPTRQRLTNRRKLIALLGWCSGEFPERWPRKAPRRLSALNPAGTAHESTRSSAARSVGSPCAGSTSSTGRSSSGRSRWRTSSRVTCLRSPIQMLSPSPKSESESPVTIAPIDGSQRMRSLSSRPAYALMPNGHAPGA